MGAVYDIYLELNGVEDEDAIVKKTCDFIEQSELAKRAKLTPGYISQIELNKIEAPTRTYQAIARAMGLRLDQMWGLA